MKKSKVLICLPSIANEDGIARAIMNYYDDNLLTRYDIDFLCVNNKESIIYKTKIENNNGKIYVIPSNNKINRYHKVKKFIKSMKTEYDIVHINLVNVYAYACAQSFKNNKTKIIFHSHNPRNYNPSLIKCINDIVHRKTETLSNVLVACSDNAGKNTFKNHYKIIPNKVEIDKFLYSEENRKIIRRNLGLDNKCFVIGVVARITEQKNPYFILEIFEEIKKIKNDSILLWIGTGIEEENIKKLCKENNLQKNVIFIKETDEIEKYYSAMDVFLLPSKYEGLGIVFIESQASGLISFASENVPKDIEISDLVTFLDANSSSKYWAENILKKAEFKINRKKYNDLIKKTIFFKKDEENELLELYNSIKEKEKI